MAKTPDSQLRAAKKNIRENCRVISMVLTKSTDQDIIDYLDTMDNKQGYLKSLIRADISRM